MHIGGRPFRIPDDDARRHRAHRPETLGGTGSARGHARPPERAGAPPYRPIAIDAPENCGPLDPAAVACTRAARTIAERLLDRRGLLRTAEIAGIIGQLEQDTVLPAEYQELVIPILRRLERDKRIAATLHAVGGARLMGPAADLVRATLNLRYCDWRIGVRDQRKAVLTALLGQLRQPPAESAIATGIALCVQFNPLACLQDLAMLVQRGKLELRLPQPAGGSGAVAEIPLAAHGSHAGADATLLVRDGMCDGIADAPGPSSAVPCALHEIPGMQAALTAIEVRNDEFEYVIGQALERMGARAAGREYRISCRQLLEQVISAGADGNALLMKAALDAFSGTQTPALLETWRRTLTLAAHREQHGWYIVDLQNAVCKAAYSALWPRTDAAASHLRLELVGELTDLMERRLRHEYHPFLPGAGPGGGPGAGKSGETSGGHALFYRRSSSDPAVRRIGSRMAFCQAMQEMVAAAAGRVEQDLAAQTGASDAKREGADEDAPAILAQMTQALQRYFGSPEFAGFIATQMNISATQELDEHGSIARVVEDHNLGWRQRREAPPVELLACYCGGRPQSAEPGPMMQQKAPSDAQPMLRQFLAGLRRRRGELRRACMVDGYPPLALPVAIDSYVFPLRLAPLYRVMVEQGGAPDDWISAALVEPALAEYRAPRGEDSWRHLARLAIRHGITLPPASGGMSVEDLHRLVMKDAGNSDGAAALRARREDLLALAFPPPAALIGMRPVGDSGGTPYLAVVYDVYRQQVSAVWTNRDGNRRMPLDEELLAGTCVVWAPPSQRPSSRWDRIRQWLIFPQ